MKSRLGKIAQLPKTIRDDLNHRLQNGKQGPELLKWLNSLPETRELLAQKFDHKPITASNLSDWRLGGFQDWRKDQARVSHIQRISESGASLEQVETGDLFENFARLAVAELAADLDTLDEMKDRDQRWQRLRELCRELARLQHGYNHSRRTDLSWTKYNHSGTGVPPVRCGPQLETPNPKPETKPQFVPIRANSFPKSPRYVQIAPCGCVCRKCHPKDGPYPYWEAEHDAADWNGGLIQRENGETFTVHHRHCDCTCVRCDSKGLPEPPEKSRKTIFRTIHHTKCQCHGTCQKCHAPDSEYPLAEVQRDEALMSEQHSSTLRGPNGISTCLRTALCQCPCEQCQRAELEQFQNLLDRNSTSDESLRNFPKTGLRLLHAPSYRSTQDSPLPKGEG